MLYVYIRNFRYKRYSATKKRIGLNPILNAYNKYEAIMQNDNRHFGGSIGDAFDGSGRTRTRLGVVISARMLLNFCVYMLRGVYIYFCGFCCSMTENIQRFKA